MIKVKEIPRKIVVEREARDTDSELRADIRRMQDAYASLRDMADYDCPQRLEELTTDAIDHLTEERVNKALADDTMLPSEIEQRVEKFKTLHRAVVRQLNIVRKIIDKWPDAKFAYDSIVMNIVPTADVETVVALRCTREVPAIAQQHGRLITTVMEAVSKLREFEKNEGIQKLRLEQLNALNADSFAELWAGGSIKRPAYSPDPWMLRAASMRELQEKQYL